MMEKQVIEAIKKLAIEFVGAYWNVPYNGFDKLFHWILHEDDTIDNNTTLDEYIELIRADNTLSFSGWIIEKIILEDGDKFNFLKGRIKTIEDEFEYDVDVIKFIFDNWNGTKSIRYFKVEIGGYTEYVKRQKVIEVWHEVSVWA